MEQIKKKIHNHYAIINETLQYMNHKDQIKTASIHTEDGKAITYFYLNEKEKPKGPFNVYRKETNEDSNQNNPVEVISKGNDENPQHYTADRDIVGKENENRDVENRDTENRNIENKPLMDPQNLLIKANDLEQIKNTPKQFRHYSDLLSLIKTDPSISDAFEAYKNSNDKDLDKSPINQFLFTPRFQDFLEHKLADKKESLKNVKSLIDQINLNNEIYYFIDFHYFTNKWDIKKIADSVPIVPDTISRHLTEMRQNRIIAEKIKDNFGKQGTALWNKFSQKNLLEKPRNFKFIEFLKENHLKNLTPEQLSQNNLLQIKSRILDAATKIDSDQIIAYFRYHRLYFMGKYGIGTIKAQEKVSKQAHLSVGAQIKMRHRENQENHTTPEDFKDLDTFLKEIKNLKSNYKIDLFKSYLSSHKYTPKIYDHMKISPQFIQSIELHHKLQPPENLTVRKLIEFMNQPSNFQTVTVSDSEINNQPYFLNNKDKFDETGKLDNLKGTNDKIIKKTENISIGKDVVIEGKPLISVISDRKLTNIIKNGSNLPDDAPIIDTESISNYLQFQQLLNSDSDILSIFETFLKEKKPQFNKRFEIFSDYLEKDLLYSDPLRAQLIDSIHDINSSKFPQIESYVKFLIINKSEIKDISANLRLSETYIRGIRNSRSTSTSPPETSYEHARKFFDTIKEIENKNEINLIDQFLSQFPNPQGSKYINNSHLTKNFEKFVLSHPVLSTTENPKIRELLNVSQKIQSNDELNHLLESFVKNSSITQIELANILMTHRSTIVSESKKFLEKIEFSKRFGTKNKNLKIGQDIHSSLEMIAIINSIENPDCGPWFSECQIFKPEFEFAVDLVNIPQKSPAVLSYLNSNFPEISNINFALFDFTDTLRPDYIFEKIAKYNPGNDSALFIVHTDGILGDPTQYTLPQSKDHIPPSDKIEFDPEHVKIIDIQQFADMLEIGPDSHLGTAIDRILIKRNREDTARIKNSIESSIQSKNVEIPSTSSFIDYIQANGYISDSQTLADVFCHFDKKTIRQTLLDLKSTREYSQPIIDTLNAENRALSLMEFREKLEASRGIILNTLHAMVEKEQLHSKESHKDNGQVILLYYTPEMKPPLDKYDEIEKMIIEEYGNEKLVEQILKDNNVSQKFYERIIKEHELSRPNIQRKKYPYIRKCIEENWNEQFLCHILPVQPCKRFIAIKNFKINGRSYFDDNNPLKQTEIMMDGKPIITKSSSGSFGYSLDTVNKKIQSVFDELAALSAKSENFNDDSLIQKYLDNSEEEFSNNYSIEQFKSDFRQHFLSNGRKDM